MLKFDVLQASAERYAARFKKKEQIATAFETYDDQDCHLVMCSLCTASPECPACIGDDDRDLREPEALLPSCGLR